MSAFDEKTEEAIKRAMERPEIKKAVGEMMIDIMPVVSAVISAALDELNNSENKRDDVNGE
jgi:hypothetical protein